MITKKSKKGFTLLEILVCFVVIALVSTLLGTKGHDLIAYHRFRCEMQSFLLDLGRFRIVSMAQGCDITCKIQKTEKHYLISWESDAPLPLEKAGMSYELQGIKKMIFSGKEVREFEVNLFSSGRISPQVLLTFVPKREEKSLTVDFAYPSYLKAASGSKTVSLTPPPYPVRKKDGESKS